jgi:tRNA-specific 2-thiouridylase
MEKKKKLRIAVAMSGGVDSSTAAYILQEEGYSVTGYTMTIGADADLDSSAVESAKAVSSRLGIDHHIVDVTEEFNSYIIRYFIKEYEKGKTPNPCALCNRFIKFGKLAEKAFSDGNDLFATGHYARLEKKPSTDLYVLKRGSDKNKDQSYFLFHLEADILKKLIFPLGSLTKQETIHIAESAGLDCRNRPESSDACFLNNSDYRDFLKLRGIAGKPGDILYLDGRILGRHTGFHNYTIGQRKGLRIAYETPLYVIRFDYENNNIIAGGEEHLYSENLKIEDVNILYPMPNHEMECQVKIRYRHTAVPAYVKLDLEGGAEITFETPQRAITPGQAAVFYNKDILIGGGWII